MASLLNGYECPANCACELNKVFVLTPSGRQGIGTGFSGLRDLQTVLDRGCPLARGKVEPCCSDNEVKQIASFSGEGGKDIRDARLLPAVEMQRGQMVVLSLVHMAATLGRIAPMITAESEAPSWSALAEFKPLDSQLPGDEKL